MTRWRASTASTEWSVRRLRQRQSRVPRRSTSGPAPKRVTSRSWPIPMWTRGASALRPLHRARGHGATVHGATVRECLAALGGRTGAIVAAATSVPRRVPVAPVIAAGRIRDRVHTTASRLDLRSAVAGQVGRAMVADPLEVASVQSVHRPAVSGRSVPRWPMGLNMELALVAQRIASAVRPNLTVNGRSAETVGVMAHETPVVARLDRGHLGERVRLQVRSARLVRGRSVRVRDVRSSTDRAAIVLERALAAIAMVPAPVGVRMVSAPVGMRRVAIDRHREIVHGGMRRVANVQHPVTVPIAADRRGMTVRPPGIVPTGARVQVASARVDLGPNGRRASVRIGPPRDQVRSIVTATGIEGHSPSGRPVRARPVGHPVRRAVVLGPMGTGRVLGPTPAGQAVPVGGRAMAAASLAVVPVREVPRPVAFRVHQSSRGVRVARSNTWVSPDAEEGLCTAHGPSLLRHRTG